MKKFDDFAFVESTVQPEISNTPVSQAANSALVQTIGQQVTGQVSPKTLDTLANGGVAVTVILSVSVLIRSLAFLVEKASD